MHVWCDSSNSAPQSHKQFFFLSRTVQTEGSMSNERLDRHDTARCKTQQFTQIINSVATRRNKCNLRSEPVCLLKPKLSDFFGNIARFWWSHSLCFCKMNETPLRSLQLSLSVLTHLSDRLFSLGADDWHQADKSHLASDY